MSNHLLSANDFQRDAGSKYRPIQTPAITMPSGGGTIKGMGETFQPDTFTGTANYSIAVPITPARGFEPDLSIDYSSGNGNGVFGIGCSLAVSGISIQTGKGTPRYNGNDVYMWNGSELVLKQKTTCKSDNDWILLEYLPRVQGNFPLIQQFVKTDRSASYWQITTNQNTVSVYGGSAASRIFDPDNPARIFVWLIDRSTDAAGNKIVYTYKAENGDNVPDKPWEQGRSYNNKYIRTIQYGNYTDQQGREQFAYELIFDYGEYVLPSGGLRTDPHQPVNKWAYRPDPFSSYESGFEIRTCRRCCNIMLFHYFENELGDPCLVNSLHFDYNQAGNLENPGLSFLSKATLAGYRRLGEHATDAYDILQTPPVCFSFSAFIPPQTPLYKRMAIDHGNISGYLNDFGFQPIDLNGEGIAGLLYHDQASIYYCSPEGQGQYDAPAFPLLFPSDRNFGNAAVALADLDGDGVLDLVVHDPQRNGYYLNKREDTWQPYTPFNSFPTHIGSACVELAGLNNNGKTDAIVVDRTHLTVYPSLGTDGYGPPVIVRRQTDFPSVSLDNLKEYVGFAAMMGDGLPHRVRISNGSVECWPNMGYGVFGKKIMLGNAPYFGDGFDRSRVLLTDIDGSGTTDIVYVQRDAITLYLNQSGNYFSNAISIGLPEPYSSNDLVSFADINGNGTNCLVYTKTGETMRHYYYEFTGETIIDGLRQTSMKPYLLVEVDNNLGIANRIEYASSTTTYLEDKKSGNAWPTRLPFPVQVVDKISVIDKINKSSYTTRFKFHDGHFDPVERKFIGFGFVETWDSQNREDDIPPVYTKMWYHTGASYDNPALILNYKAHFFRGDKKAYDFPDVVFDDSIYRQDSDTRRQAWLSLKGQVMRTEVYADDKEIHPLLYQNPYTVTESNQKVLLYQEKESQSFAVFLVVPRESISYNYERNPGDPRVQQTFTLVTDAFGNTIESCSIHLPRRPNDAPDFVRYPEQYAVRGYLTWVKYVDVLDGFLFCDVSCEDQQFELAGIQPGIDGYFSFEGIKGQVDTIGLPDRSKIIPYGGTFTSGVQARQVDWNRQYFWNWANPQQDPLLGIVSSPALLHHTEEAVFTKEFTIDVFDGRVIDDAAYKDEGYLSNVICTRGGYFYNPDPNNGYWWNKGLVQYYLSSSATTDGPPCFYLPWKSENSFARELQDPSLVASTYAAYDVYYLFPIQVTEQVDILSSNTLFAKIDYVAGQPKELIDYNGNTTQVLFDALGQVTVSSIFGKENGISTGGMTLYTDGSGQAGYRDPGKGSFTEVINNPEKFLQGAGTYFFYNLNAWIESQQPVGSIHLLRNHYWNSPDPADGPYCQVLVNYVDGLGRDLEKKVKSEINKDLAENIIEDNWQVTGRTVYNNKGKPSRQYLPYFSSFPEYEDQENIPGPPPTVMHYDPLLREIRIDTPKKFFSQITFTPWERLNYDEDDTILDSYFYQYEYPGNLTPDEIDAIAKAVKFYNTPSIAIFDNEGAAFLEIRNNLGNVPTDAFKSLERPGIRSDEIWADLLLNGYLAPYPGFPKLRLYFLTGKFQPYTRGFVLRLDPKYDPLLVQIVDMLKENCLTSYYATDALGRTVMSVDPRLYYGDITHNTGNYNFKYTYAMTGSDPVLIDSADAGIEKHLPNIFGSQLWTWTPRSYCQLLLYDRFQRKTAAKVKKITTPGPVISYEDFNLVEVMTYGEGCADAAARNLRGQLYQVNDLSGIVTNPSYTMLGQPMETSRQMLTDYKKANDWATMLSPLDPTVYRTTFVYNSVQQMCAQTTPDGSVTSNTYDQAGRLRAIVVQHPAANAAQSIIDAIGYDAKGQRAQVKYGNGIVTRYAYEETTLRLIGIKSVRPASGNDTPVVQDLEYYYDPAGNITRTLDNTAKIIFCNNQRIDPLTDYTYNANYRLITASGRQHTGITTNTYQDNAPDSFMQCIFGPPPFIADAAGLENYTETYTYDDSGNLIYLKHTASAGTSWSRDLAVEDGSNRLRNRAYDASGNLRRLDISSDVDLTYNCCEHLVRTGIIKRLNQPDDCEYYLYDSSEGRTRKVCEKMGQGGALTLVEDKIYLGNFEIKRNSTVGAHGTSSVNAERQTLRIMDDRCCVGMIHYTPVNTAHREKEGSVQYRFQMDNNIGTVCLEMDAAAQLISYEEYFPYGGTSIITGVDQAEVKAKDYRYSGKECDDNTGLYYYGARYYVSWQCRWLNPDPAGTVDGMNVFAFVGGNPLVYDDADGRIKRSRRVAGLDPENNGLPDLPRASSGDMLKMRVRPNKDGSATGGYNAKGKSFKSSLRIHWKGYMDKKTGNTTGIVPYITKRDSRAWDKTHVNSTRALSATLMKGKKFTPLDNGSAEWGAENSHIIAGSLWGPNDVLSAPPASVHQNTEWLAIETGIKSLIRKAGLGDDLRIKATGYVHESGAKQGWLKSARYKIYIGGKKVFDHVSIGDRGNIDDDEAQALKEKVAGLTAKSPAAHLFIGKGPNRKLSPAAPPTLQDIQNNRTESVSSPMFTGLMTDTGYLRGKKAFDHMSALY